MRRGREPSSLVEHLILNQAQERPEVGIQHDSCLPSILRAGYDHPPTRCGGYRQSMPFGLHRSAGAEILAATQRGVPVPGHKISTASNWDSWPVERHDQSGRHPTQLTAVIAESAVTAVLLVMPNSYEQIRGHLAQAEGADTAAHALHHLRLVLAEASKLLDEQLARAVIDDEMSIAAAGNSAGLTENAVGPRLASTPRLAPYATTESRVTAEGVKRARNDKWAGSPLPPSASPEPMRFKPRRNTKRS